MKPISTLMLKLYALHPICHTISALIGSIVSIRYYYMDMYNVKIVLYILDICAINAINGNRAI
jgi:hypothetical protein